MQPIFKENHFQGGNQKILWLSVLVFSGSSAICFLRELVFDSPTCNAMLQFLHLATNRKNDAS